MQTMRFLRLQRRTRRARFRARITGAGDLSKELLHEREISAGSRRTGSVQPAASTSSVFRPSSTEYCAAKVHGLRPVSDDGRNSGGEGSGAALRSGSEGLQNLELRNVAAPGGAIRGHQGAIPGGEGRVLRDGGARFAGRGGAYCAE